MSPEQIVLIARAGSHLYDLAKVDSDADYVIIYADPLQVMPVFISLCLDEEIDGRNWDKTVSDACEVTVDTNHTTNRMLSTFT